MTVELAVDMLKVFVLSLAIIMSFGAKATASEASKLGARDKFTVSISEAVYWTLIAILIAILAF